MDKVGGMNGCKGGWVLVTTPVIEGTGPSTVERVAGLGDAIELVDAGELVAVAIDIPIGLPDLGPRRCDVEARAMIGPRRSSVFPAPLRGVLGAKIYLEAAERSLAISGKSLSKQAFAILPKIEEVDRLMSPARQQTVIEVHPEVSFTALAGHPMAHHKSEPEGRQERLRALSSAFAHVDELANRRLPGANTDDVLDALVGAWSARRWVLGSYKRLGGEVDGRGLRMEMIA